MLWNEAQGIWQDYDLINKIQRPYFYGSNIAPLWAGCWDPLTPLNTSVVDKVLSYLEESKATKYVTLKGRHSLFHERLLTVPFILSFVGGVPTSMINSGQQWDYPNGWPPLQVRHKQPVLF